ncbi:MAG: hypothetical protein EBX67_06445 [Betaproteobacteria bacterium]|nr:hypothetical protein [Betaproteobacteria bacterium]
MEHGSNEFARSLNLRLPSTCYTKTIIHFWLLVVQFNNYSLFWLACQLWHFDNFNDFLVVYEHYAELCRHT